MSFLSVTDLNKFAGSGESRFHILKNINLHFEHGEFVAIVGPSGSGKSTLMNILGCLDVPTSGSYSVEGIETGQMDPDQLAELRSNKFGFIFQRYNLLNSLSAVENVALPAIYAMMPEKERLVRAQELLQTLDLATKANNKPCELSGGQQQRVSIARALMNGGEVILADEPTGALDSEAGEAVMGVLRDLNRQGHTIILVTHNSEIAAYASRTIEIRDGKIVADHKITARPPSPMQIKAATHHYSARSLVVNQLVESFKMSLQSIVAHKLRSILTMLGIVIGIASVITVVALGRGSQEKILADIRAMGTNTIEIFPGDGFGDMQAWRIKSLTVDDTIILAQQNYVAGVTPNINTQGVTAYAHSSANTLINGVSSQFINVKGLKMESGRFLLADDIEEITSVAVIDQKAKSALFPDEEQPVGKIIICNKQPLEVIGVVKERKISTGPSEKNPNIFVPYTTAMHKIIGTHDISSITVKMRDDVNSQVAEKSIIRLLTQLHDGKKDFFTFNIDSIKKTVEKTTDTLKLLISGIALISLAVGGIGVMNIMLVSVTERTVEIGIRMAIGARRYNILTQFLIEAVIICLVGGFLGIIFSLLASPVFQLFTENLALSYSVGSAILALCCSIFMGVLFGFMPASSASRLSPIVALARE